MIDRFILKLEQSKIKLAFKKSKRKLCVPPNDPCPNHKNVFFFFLFEISWYNPQLAFLTIHLGKKKYYFFCDSKSRKKIFIKSSLKIRIILLLDPNLISLFCYLRRQISILRWSMERGRGKVSRACKDGRRKNRNWRGGEWRSNRWCLFQGGFAGWGGRWEWGIIVVYLIQNILQWMIWAVYSDVLFGLISAANKCN